MTAGEEFRGIRRILVAIDFSESVPVLVRYAMEIVRGRGAHLRLLHAIRTSTAGMVPSADAVPGLPLTADLRAAAEERMREIAAGIRGIAVDVKAVLGPPAAGILREAREWPADVVVVATHGRRGLPRMFLGSVAEAVVRGCPCPVLAVRHRSVEEPATDAPAATAGGGA
jgi:nucleotide-binding universal stress UspA family protein